MPRHAAGQRRAQQPAGSPSLLVAMATGAENGAFEGGGPEKRSLKRGISQGFSQMKENLVHLVEEVDEERGGLADGEKAAMARLGSTLFDLIVHYVQTFSTISRSPTAERIWADWDLPDVFGWFTLDLFVLPVWDIPELGLGTQTKIFVLLVPILFLYWVSEVVWHDSVKWRRDYVEHWAMTKKKLSPYHPLVPVFPSLVTGVAMSMGMLVFVVPKVTIAQGISTFLAFYFIQLVYGALMLGAVSLAKVYYAEYRHETIDEDLPTEHTVDQRPDFFYGIRDNARQVAQVLLGVFYLPLCIGVLHMMEEVRQIAREREDPFPTCVLCNWYTEGIERYMLALNVVEVAVLVVTFTVGAPAYMIHVIKERRKHFVWLDADEKRKLEEETDDVERDRRVVLQAVAGGSKLAQKLNHSKREEALAIDAMVMRPVATNQSASRKELSEKGKWLWSPVSERPHREYNIFQLEHMVSEQQELGVPWFVMHRTVGKICCCCRKRVLKENHVLHGSAVRLSIERLEEARRTEWEFGYEDYQRKQGEMSGMDSMWMCCSQRWIYWKVYTGFFEKYILFALSANMLSSLVNKQCYSTFRAKFILNNRYVPERWEDGSWNTTTLSSAGSLDNRYTNNEYTARLGLFDTGGSAAAEAGSWQTESVVDVSCERVTAIGMLAFCTTMFFLGVVCQPFLDVKQDKVDSACRFAGTSTSFALVLAVYDVFDDIYILLIVLVPNLLAIFYAIYIINPGEMAAGLAVEVRAFLRARQLGKQKKEEQEMHNNRRLFKAALAGDHETVSETIKKYDDTLDINYKFPPRSEDETTADASEDKHLKLVGLTPIHAAASAGNLRCLRELLNFGLYKYDRLKHDVEWTSPGGITWQPIANPLQMAWENGCAQVVALLNDIGFELDVDAGRDVLRGRLVETLVPAGKHPERGSKDLVWILGDGIEDPSLADADRPALDLNTAVESAMASLVMRHEWEGLAQFMFATKRDTIELWESWVNMSVVRAVAGVCGDLLNMFHVEAGTFTVSNVIEIANGPAPFSTLAMVFHGALELDGRDAGENAREKSMREMMQQVSNASLTFYIAGVSRFMKHALPQSYKYVSQAFITDHSQSPTQWTLTLNTRGTTYLDVFLTYKTRINAKSPPKMVMASMVITCKYVTKQDKKNVSRPVQITTRTFERDRELMVANFDVSKCLPDSGLELIEIRLAEVFIMDPIKETKCREVMKGGIVVRPGTMVAEWRMCGLPNMLPAGSTSSPEVFIESNSIVTRHGTIQLAVHVGEISQDAMVDDEKMDIDDEWFHTRLQQLVGSDADPGKGASKEENAARKKWKKASKKMHEGDIRKLSLKQGEIELNFEGRVNALADVELSIISPMIVEALELFNQPENQKLRQLSFTENISSTARKYIHIEAKRRGLQHRSRTNKHSGARKLMVTKPLAGVDCDYPINLFVGNVGSEPVDRQSFALRIEEEIGVDSIDDGPQRWSRRVLNHCFLTDVSLDEDSTHTFGCSNMVFRSDLDGGDFPGSLVTVIRYQYDEKNRPEPRNPPSVKGVEGEALLRGSSDEATLHSIFEDLLVLPPTLVPHNFVLPEGTAGDLISHGRFYNRKKGETLAVAGDHFSDFVVLMHGAAATPSGSYEEKQWDHKENNAIGSIRDFLYGCGIEHQHTAIATSNCRIFSIRRTAALHAGGVGPAPRGFSPPAYQTLHVDTENEDARTTTVRWVLHGSAALLSDRSSLVSDYFDVPQTEYNQCAWRLHLIPRDNVNRRQANFPNHTDNAKALLKGVDAPLYVGVFVGCTMHESLSQKQLDKGTYEISAMHDEGTVGERTASLAEGYPTHLQLLSDDEIGWGFSLGETYHGMAKNSRWEIQVKISIDPKHSTGFGVQALVSEAQWAVENSIVLAQTGLAEVGNFVGAVAIGGEAGKIGDRIVPKSLPRGGGRRRDQLKRSKSSSRAASAREVSFSQALFTRPFTRRDMIHACIFYNPCYWRQVLVVRVG